MDKLYKLILFSIFFVPLSAVLPFWSGTVWLSQYIALLVICLLGVAIFLYKFNKYITLFLIIALFSAIFTAHTTPKAVLQLIQIHFCCLFAYIVSLLNEEQRRNILFAIIWMAIIQGIWVIVQYLNMDPIFSYIGDRSKDDTVGFVGSHNQLGLFFAMCAPVVIAYCPFIMPLIVFGLWCSTTATAWVATIISCFVYLFRKSGKRILILFFIFFFIASIIYFVKFDDISYGKYKERRDLYKKTIYVTYKGEVLLIKKNKYKIVRCNPLFGYGLGNFMRIMPYAQYDVILKGAQHVYAHTHNDYLEWFFETGYTGAIALIMLLFNFFRTFIKARKTKILLVSFCGILSQMICALGIFTVQTAVSGMLLVVFYGIFMGEIREQRLDYGEITCLG